MLMKTSTLPLKLKLLKSRDIFFTIWVRYAWTGCSVIIFEVHGFVECGRLMCSLYNWFCFLFNVFFNLTLYWAVWHCTGLCDIDIVLGCVTLYWAVWHCTGLCVIDIVLGCVTLTLYIKLWLLNKLNLM